MSPPLALERLVTLAPLPYRRGAEQLEIPVGVLAAGWFTVQAYNFEAYRIRHGALPEAPRYLVTPSFEVSRAPMVVELELDRGGALEIVSVELPPDTPAGLSFAVPQRPGDDASVRIRRLRPQSALPAGAPLPPFRLLALLGNLSKLLWVVSRGQDELAHWNRRVGLRASLADARGAALDLTGRDLRVPRFPPRPYSFDADTLALYHFDEHPVANGGAFQDETARFGLPGHPATSVGTVSGAPGRFGRGLALSGGPGAPRVEIPSHADFQIPANRDTTVELFVRVESGSTPRVLAVKGDLDAAGELTATGWALTVGDFRGLTNNPRLSLRAGAVTIDLFADVDLADRQVHHLAAAINRTTAQARLWIDGKSTPPAALGALGAIANARPVRLGASAGSLALTGLIDEVRFSRVARSDFAPVLGEGDEAYRRRLDLFRRWLLPTPLAVADALNAVVSIGGDPRPIVVAEKDRPLAGAGVTLRLVPRVVPAGTGISSDGGTRGDAASIAGAPDDEGDFRPEWLLRHDEATAEYPGGESARRMQLPTFLALRRLLETLASHGVAGKVRLLAGYDPEATDLRRVGRALLLGHSALSNAELAAWAHRAGFDWVENRGEGVVVAVAVGARLAVEVTPPPPAQRPSVGDVLVGGAIDLQLRPALPATAQISWSLARCGSGGGTLVSQPADVALRLPPTARPRLRFQAGTAGEVVVQVSARLGGSTASGSVTLRLIPKPVADGAHLTAAGDATIPQDEAVGTPEADFSDTWLVQHASGVSFVADPNARRMQVATDRRLERLAEVLGGPAERAQLTVLRAFAPGDPGLHGVGRAVRFSHAALDGGALASLAHQAGFAWVERQGAEVVAIEPSADPLEIVDSATGRPLAEELELEVPLTVKLRQQPAPAGELYWSAEPFGSGELSLSSTVRPEIRVTAKRTGVVSLSLLHVAKDLATTPPYSYEVSLRADLEAAGVIVPKTEYDLIMNLIHTYRPIGTEVLTRRLRERVVEVRDHLLAAFPGYTFPDFRP